MGKRSPLRVLVVDDHPAMRRGVVDIIDSEDDFVVCGEAGTAADALRALAQLRPDILVLDLGLPDHSGLSVIRDALEFLPELPILVFSMHAEDRFAQDVLLAGARGYLRKDGSARRIIEAVRRIVSGQVYVSGKAPG